MTNDNKTKLSLGSEQEKKDFMKEILKCISFQIECEYCKKKINGNTKEECSTAFKAHIENDCPVINTLRAFEKAGITKEDMQKLSEAKIWKRN
jgi:hypothetical protein